MREFLQKETDSTKWINFIRAMGLEGGLVSLYAGSLITAFSDTYPCAFDLKQPEGEHWHPPIFQRSSHARFEERQRLAVA